MLNWIWAVMLALAVMCGALTGRMDAVTRASVDSAKVAVELAIGLVGAMALWIGLMHALQQAGFLKIVARVLKPVTRRIFPEVPADHPAMSMMILNMTANMLGLANAATPFGLKAMIELDRLNPQRGTATDAMALFLAINTSNLALLPTGMIALRVSLGAEQAGSIWLPTLCATTVSTLVAIVIAKTLAPLPMFAVTRTDTASASTSNIKEPGEQAASDTEGKADREEIDTSEAEELIARDAPGATRPARLAVWLMVVAIGVTLSCGIAGLWVDLQILGATPYASAGEFFSTVLEVLKIIAAEWLLALLAVTIVLFGLSRGVKVYDAVVEGGKEGFGVALRIIPFLVAILVAVGMLRASGAIDILVSVLEPATALIGMPAEVLPMAILRTLSGNGAYAVAGEIMTTHGPDSLIGNIVSTMQGSTETTFYVLALYFGVIGIRRVRHTLVACLVADTAGVLAAVWFTRLFLT